VICASFSKPIHRRIRQTALVFAGKKSEVAENAGVFGDKKERERKYSPKSKNRDF